ncbi:hypothetical protein ILYODFUR_027212 [Ilyodon furcidens]|uniref:Uncharacterized protein n=1 Tax=Ilyodon furcidens TaxID=33524 RepID=A0ABV0V9X9_9TELE
MDDDDYQYQLFLKLMNETYDTTDPSYVVSKTVQLCAKKTVNQFGAKLIPVFYYVNFLLSYLGNGLVLLIIYKHLPSSIFPVHWSCSYKCDRTFPEVKKTLKSDI